MGRSQQLLWSEYSDLVFFKLLSNLSPNTVTKKQFYASDQNGVVEIGNFSQIYVHIYFMDQA